MERCTKDIIREVVFFLAIIAITVGVIWDITCVVEVKADRIQSMREAAGGWPETNKYLADFLTENPTPSWWDCQKAEFNMGRIRDKIERDAVVKEIREKAKKGEP